LNYKRILFLTKERLSFSKASDMLVMNYINPSEIESSLGIERSKPIIDAFNNIVQVLKENQDVLDNQQEIIDKQQSFLHDQEAVIHEIKAGFEKYKNGDLDRKAEIKKDLLIELATKADIEILNGQIGILKQEMNGKIDSLKQEMNGEFKNIKLWMKMLLALALLTIACFSPTAQVLIKLLKF